MTRTQRLKLCCLSLGLCLASSANAIEEIGTATEVQTQHYRLAVQDYQDSLKYELEQALGAHGPVGAIGLCGSKAALVSAEHAQREGWRLGRVSLKPRNPDNAPDAWEQSVLEAFAARLAAGEDPAQLEYTRIVEDQGRYAIRYMRAIPTQSLCLNCHGADLAAEVSAQLRERYPNDQATGFKVGDLRGAFSLSHDLSRPASCF